VQRSRWTERIKAPGARNRSKSEADANRIRTNKLRRTGIKALGEMPGVRISALLRDQARPPRHFGSLFQSGIGSNEFCLWVTQLLTVTEATEALKKSIPGLEKHLANRSIEILVPSESKNTAWQTSLPDLRRYIANGSIEIVPHDQWYLEDGKFDSRRVVSGWKEKLDRGACKRPCRNARALARESG